MKVHFKMPASLLTILLLCLSAKANAQQLTDQAGRMVTVPDHPERIVSLIPSITEMVFLLGKGNIIVGTSAYSNRPEAARYVPVIGSYARPDLERIMALAPDLCLASQDGNPLYVVRRLEQLGIPVFLLNPRDIGGIEQAVLLLGRLLGTKDRAKRIVACMKAQCTVIDDAVARIHHRPRVFFQVDVSPIISAGSGTFIDTLITRAGGVNLAAGPQAYPRYSWEDIIAMRPEVVLLSSMAGGYNRKDLLSLWLKWPQIPAVKNGHVYVVDADLFDRPVPRSVEGLGMLFRMLHPGIPLDRPVNPDKSLCGRYIHAASPGHKNASQGQDHFLW